MRGTNFTCRGRGSLASGTSLQTARMVLFFAAISALASLALAGLASVTFQK